MFQRLRTTYAIFREQMCRREYDEWRHFDDMTAHVAGFDFHPDTAWAYNHQDKETCPNPGALRRLWWWATWGRLVPTWRGVPRRWWAATLHRTRWVRYVVGAIGNAWRAAPCHGPAGHDWVDNSTAGPDSGDMDMFCQRCGHTFHHQLY